MYTVSNNIILKYIYKKKQIQILTGTSTKNRINDLCKFLGMIYWL